ILNEGNFMASNGSVTRLDLSSGTVINDYFAIQNGGLQIGDVPQSMSEFNGKFYIVINNSGKIIVVDKFNFQNVAQISGLNSPRYILFTSNSRAFVSDLYSNSISVIDLNTNTKVKDINLNGWTEEMIQMYGKVYVTNKQSTKLYVLNSQTETLEDSLDIGYGAGSIKQDKNGKIWILCSGNQTNKYAKLVRINPISLSVDTSFIFSSLNNKPYKLAINGQKDILYYLDAGGVYSMNIYGNLSTAPLISQGQKNFYALGVDPQTGQIYVGDAIDFNQNGVIYRYNSDGSQLDQFNAGIIPGFIFFDK
ncbi:MAG: DUF5074 domain-containing protein, partial [Bacteroidota bacterium]